MQYIASLSYGKDSLAMLEVIKENAMPLDRIVHVEVMATPTISADLPPMVEFKGHADKVIKKRYGIEVERLKAVKSYEECFYYVKSGRSSHNVGSIYGFPYCIGAWCNSRLKVNILKTLHKNNITYIGIASDEPNRFHSLSDIKRSPLVEHDIGEAWCREWCEKNNLLSPIYTTATRGGCWFCHNQNAQQLRLLRQNYPEYWALMMKWDSDSPVTFKPNGMTIHDYDNMFQFEEQQVSLF